VTRLAADRLCILASSRADDVTGPAARLLREAGLTLWPWPPADPQASVPQDFDALVVLGPTTALPASSVPVLVALLRQAWLDGATIGLFDGAASLLAASEIAPDGAPLEAAGLFMDDALPSAGVVQEMIDALQAGPHRER
jgi:hypothetical protein